MPWPVKVLFIPARDVVLVSLPQRRHCLCTTVVHNLPEWNKRGIGFYVWPMLNGQPSVLVDDIASLCRVGADEIKSPSQSGLKPINIVPVVSEETVRRHVFRKSDLYESESRGNPLGQQTIKAYGI